MTEAGLHLTSRDLWQSSAAYQFSSSSYWCPWLSWVSCLAFLGAVEFLFVSPIVNRFGAARVRFVLSTYISTVKKCNLMN